MILLTVKPTPFSDTPYLEFTKNQVIRKYKLHQILQSLPRYLNYVRFCIKGGVYNIPWQDNAHYTYSRIIL